MNYYLQLQTGAFYFIIIIIKLRDKLNELKKSVGLGVFFQLQFYLDLKLPILIIFVNLKLVF